MKIETTQKLYRSTLNAFSHPGKVFEYVADLSDFPFKAAMSFLAFSQLLLDSHVSACFHGFEYSDVQLVQQLTGVRISSASESDMLFLNGSDSFEYLSQAKRGTFIDPHLGATVVVFSPESFRIQTEVEGERSMCRLEGPGIPSSGTMLPINSEILRLRNERCSEFPLGIELVLINEGNMFTVIPRSTRIVSEVMQWPM
jgi:alpha-D-ribose 1-methylphosphonate 5-triphosphate synthase subunit PhnH